MKITLRLVYSKPYVMYIMENMDQPSIFAETGDFTVVFKPPRMHSAPLNGASLHNGDTLLDWYATIYPPVMDISGRKEGEGGLLHRLDFETQGLVLFAKNQKSLDCILAQQEQGNFIKEYSAVCSKTSSPPASFPPPPGVFEHFLRETPRLCSSFVIESFFRPFGPGRKQVRPVTDDNTKPHRHEVAKDLGGYYRTEIINVENTADSEYAFTIRLRRGFRHQIRCHLAWIGCPVLNDSLYGEQPANGFLALRSQGLIFADPDSGEQREYRTVRQATP